MNAPEQTSLREGDIVRYTPEQRWCHEGLAEAITRRDGSIVLVDTYWLNDRRTVTPDAFEVLFNLGDYEPCSPDQWQRYAPADRQVVTGQHGLTRHHYVRRGAVESREQVIANARAALAEAEEQVRSAESNRKWRQRELDELLAATTPEVHA